MNKRFLIAFSLLLSCTLANGQSTDSIFVLPDSARAFSLQNFYELILANHPTAKQVGLLSEVARQEIRLARGNFDPKLEAQFSSKKANGKDYYSIFNGSLKFPTIFPIDPSIGMDQNKGPYLNPERYIDAESDYRQLYAGISIPLGRGLMTDERRTALRQAELFKDMTEADQVKIINKLALDAAKIYWEWYAAYYNYRLLNSSVQIARQIFDRVKINYTFGEASAMDTLQAHITWQQRLIEQQEALVNFKNAGVELSNMLWNSSGNPLDVDPTWVPVLQSSSTISAEELAMLLEQAQNNHPDLRKIEIRISQLEAERRLAAEFLKPQLNLNYYALNQPISAEGSFSFLAEDNYKLGIDFSFPVFLRKERSKLELTKLKISSLDFQQSLMEREILNSLITVHNQLLALQSITANQFQMVESYERLLQRELLNLDQGESDLFKINVQQEKLILAQGKWIKLLADNEKQKAHLYWAAGTYRVGR